MLEKQIHAIEKQIIQLIESDDDWDDKSKILYSVPGIGLVTAATLLTELPELGLLNRKEIQPWRASLLITETVASSVVDDQFTVVVLLYEKLYIWQC
ncbi:MAG: hypothetical protein R3C11_25330 [Planctomycetaceae bacterium]